MLIADSHTHSLCSFDASFPMDELARGAIENGVDILVVTDHVDISYGPSGEPDNYCFEAWPEMQYHFYEAHKEYSDKIDLRLGIELGEANHRPDFAREIASCPGLDFVIGSTHNTRGEKDFYHLKYESRAQCLKYIEIYLSEVLEVAALDFIDVVAHIGYTRRYMKRAGFDIGYDDYTDVLTEIFKTAISSGTGIELNTSGLRQDLRDTLPTMEQVRLYRDCGGEIITVGSDAHNPRDIGAGIREAYDMLSEIGFNYVAVFKNRKPEFIKI